MTNVRIFYEDGKKEDAEGWKDDDKWKYDHEAEQEASKEMEDKISRGEKDVYDEWQE